jgi:Family of unknown function (DUF6544)
VLTSWAGQCSAYKEFDGFRVPSSVEVAWNLADGPFTYARFVLTTLEYTVAEPF